MPDLSSTTPSFPNPLQEAIYWRGLFLHRYAAVEHAVTELLARAHNAPAYASLGEVPFKWPGRIRRLMEVLETPGPLSEYGSLVREWVAEFSLAEKYRHLFVHGVMQCGWREGEPRSLMVRSHHWEGGLHEITLETSVDLLRETTEQLGPFATRFTSLVAFIFNEENLGPRPKEQPYPIEVKPRDI